MSVNKSDPIYPISVAAKLLGVHPRTLRIYEEEGLIKPARQGNKRYFSEDDIEWIKCLRQLIHDEGISIPGIKKLLELSPCWEIKNCPQNIRDNCSAFVNKATPCWERASTACAKGIDKCENCEIYIGAMKEAKGAINEQETETNKSEVDSVEISQNHEVRVIKKQENKADSQFIKTPLL
ncbi:HspR, transcriptional repressor of DnaK operon [Dissulfuribacter thermophilus]|uniref:HspR, transcriptional repressor of DnaK operon n=1 Tax=Dissulfuribacter thermophilus TaxID=1156395 RepID=A0A1B9F9L1_9BACT|nr:MerR family transcriptional regulator [Dissulfuribacter thermophilus]OCC16563.1 HspR, transcriptional repressor of DnaK operon [Dissulfuribacter thermophilus]